MKVIFSTLFVMSLIVQARAETGKVVGIKCFGTDVKLDIAKAADVVKQVGQVVSIDDLKVKALGDKKAGKKHAGVIENSKKVTIVLDEPSVCQNGVLAISLEKVQ